MDQWGLECDQECKACNGSCRSDDKTCGILLRCDHLQCTVECDDGYYVTNCTSPCPTNCKTGECDVQSGQCIGGCKAGYDGVKCENEDLVTPVYASMIPSDASNILSDDDYHTCIWNDKLSIDLKNAYYIRWMRIGVNYPQHLNNLRICFRNNANESIKGSTYSKLVSNGRTIDIQLLVTDRIRYIQIEGYTSCQLCLLRIGGGRNVALKQSTNQSSTYNDGARSLATNAVDGNTDSEYSHGSCSLTDHNDESPTWSLSLHTTRFISRIVLYNKNRGKDHLHKYILKLFDENETEVFSYQDTSTTAQTKYTVIPDNFVQAKTLTITATDRSQGLYLSLCEVEIYSDCPLGRWGFECYNECKACDGSCRFDDGTCGALLRADHLQCTKSCDVGYSGTNCSSPCPTNCKTGECDVQSGQCTGGCKAGYDGDKCENACSSGYYGENCKERCSINCKTENCDSKSGICHDGCKSGYVGDKCDRPCSLGSYGRNCVNNCSNNCMTNGCDSKSGYCDGGCKDGFMGNTCQESCSKGHYGMNCSRYCSDLCVNQTCDRSTGRCFACLPGFKGTFCDSYNSPEEQCEPSFTHGLAVGAAAVVLLAVVFVLVYRREYQKIHELISQHKDNVYDTHNVPHEEFSLYEGLNPDMKMKENVSEQSKKNDDQNYENIYEETYQNV
ncbi:hypothetical protein Btru_026753 [Bulinus truncatus]|nr:hypothetical protein Btru_026753 [Bulinus truncatus]